MLCTDVTLHFRYWGFLFLNTQINPLLQGNKNRFQTTISQKSDPVCTKGLENIF